MSVKERVDYSQIELITGMYQFFKQSGESELLQSLAQALRLIYQKVVSSDKKLFQN